MKVLAKKITAIVMVLVIIASASYMPQKVEASGFYTITLDANGGYFSRVGSSVQNIKMPIEVGLKVSSYYLPDARSEYSFLGWSTSKTAVAAMYTVNASLPRKNATYYAVWRCLSTAGVKIDQSNVSVKMGMTQKLTATVLPDYATNKSVKWTSSNTNIFKIASDGTITPVRPGTATVTVTTVSGGYQASTTVTVVQGVNVSVDVTANCDTKQTITYAVAAKGETEDDKIVGYYFDGTYEAITATNATSVEKEVDTATIHTFRAVAANGATNYTSATSFYEVTFNSNDNNNNTKKCLFSYGAMPLISVTKDMFIREGYSLAGWSTNPNATQPDDIFVRGASEYYAVWYKVNISDDSNVISKDIIDVKKSYNPTQIYITVTAPDGSIVDYDTDWSIIKKDNTQIPSYRLEKGNLLYTESYATAKNFSITSSDGLLTGNVKVNLYENITVVNEKIINEDGTCTVVYYIHFKESSLKSYELNGKEYSVTDVIGYDERTNTYRIENVVTFNRLDQLKIIGEDNSYVYTNNWINIFEENYGITMESTLTDKKGMAAATVTLKCGKVEDSPQGYYLGESENYKENDFYSLSESNNDNNVTTIGGYYIVSHYIRKAGKYYYTPIDADGKSQGTYEMTVYAVTLDTNGGNLLGENKYYVFQNNQIVFNQLPTPINSKKNQLFRGWYSPDGIYTSVKVTSALTLIAKWRTNPFKDENGNDTGYSFEFDQFRFGFTNFRCTRAPEISQGHCGAIAALVCRFVTAENDFNVSDFKKVGTNGILTAVNKISEFTNITGKENDTVYINSKTGITLYDYLCGYQHGFSGMHKPSSTEVSSVKGVLEAAKNIKNTGVPIQVSIRGLLSNNSSVVSMAHALVAYDVKKVKSTSDYTEYSLSIYDCNDEVKERTLSIWCNGDEDASDSEWGWKYVWDETNTLGSDYMGSTLSATIYDCNN